MGIHSGPVSGVMDVNERTNVAGAGINLAQRVMDCGDAGHILVSKHVAEDLEEYEQWRPLLHDLGTCEVKHGVRVGDREPLCGSSGQSDNCHKKFQALKKRRARVRWAERRWRRCLRSRQSSLASCVFSVIDVRSARLRGKKHRGASVRKSEPKIKPTPTLPTAFRMKF